MYRSLPVLSNICVLLVRVQTAKDLVSGVSLMGNSVGIASVVPRIGDLVKLRSSPTDNHNFSSYLYLWKFFPNSVDELFIQSYPVSFNDFEGFEAEAVYVILHIYNVKSENTEQSKEIKQSADTAPATSLLHSARECFTPRGLDQAEDGASVSFQCQTVVKGESLYDLYLWTGKDSPDIVHAVALAALYEASRNLKQHIEAGHSVNSIIDLSTIIPISTSVHDDLLNLKDSHTDSIVLSQNHLFSRVTANARTSNALKSSLSSQAVRALRRENTLSHLDKLMIGESRSTRRRASTPVIALKEKVKDKETPKKQKKTKFSVAPDCERVGSARRSTKGKAEVKMKPLAIPERPMLKKPPQRSTSMPMQKVGPLKLGGGLGLNISAVSKKEPGTVQESKEEKFKRFDRECSQITNKIFLSSIRIAKDKGCLLENGITHILNCAGVACPEFFPHEFKYKTLQLMDGGEDIASIFYDVLDFFQEVHKDPDAKILVHCYQGVSRSSSMVILYLMWKDATEYDPTFERVKDIRGVCKPNTAFMCQLLAWYQQRNGPFKLRLYRITPLNERTPKYWAMRKAHTEKEHPTMLNLDPRFSFILRAEEVIYVWRGEGSTDDQYEHACKYATALQEYENAPERVQEEIQGKESDAFVTLLGGEVQVMPRLSNDKDYEIMQLPAGPFLFKYPEWSRVTTFTKRDLRSSRAYMLQDDMRLFAWVGSRFTYEGELVDSHNLDKVREHIVQSFRSMVTERVPPADTPVSVVFQGKETPQFWEGFIGRS